MEVYFVLVCMVAAYVIGWYAGYLTGRFVAAQQATAKARVQTKDLYPKE